MKICSIAEKRVFTVGYMKVMRTSAIMHSPCTDANLGVCNFRIFVNAFLADSEETPICEKKTFAKRSSLTSEDAIRNVPYLVLR
jgi:hypothetical protein